MKFPEKRTELISNLKSLSSWEYQKKCWVLQDCPKKVEHDNFDLSVHFLFDDTELATDPESEIDYILKNKIEAKAVKNVCDQVDNIFKLYGYECTDDEYINYSEWRSVINSASVALKVIQSDA
jgi:hypothetical protein